MKKTEGSIGYVEFVYASRQGLPYVSLKNKSGEFVVPSTETFHAAASHADWSATAGFYMVPRDQPGKRELAYRRCLICSGAQRAAGCGKGKSHAPFLRLVLQKWGRSSHSTALCADTRGSVTVWWNPPGRRKSRQRVGLPPSGSRDSGLAASGSKPARRGFLQPEVPRDASAVYSSLEINGCACSRVFSYERLLFFFVDFERVEDDVSPDHPCTMSHGVHDIDFAPS